jgi:hypothetical protein
LRSLQCAQKTSAISAPQFVQAVNAAPPVVSWAPLRADRSRGSRYGLISKDSVVTIAGTFGEPIWNASVSTTGTVNSASYVLTESANPEQCTFPTRCWSKAGASGTGAFGYAVAVHEAIGTFNPEPYATFFTGGTLDITFW